MVEIARAGFVAPQGAIRILDAAGIVAQRHAEQSTTGEPICLSGDATVTSQNATEQVSLDDCVVPTEATPLDGTFGIRSQPAPGVRLNIDTLRLDGMTLMDGDFQWQPSDDQQPCSERRRLKPRRRRWSARGSATGSPSWGTGGRRLKTRSSCAFLNRDGDSMDTGTINSRPFRFLNGLAERPVEGAMRVKGTDLDNDLMAAVSPDPAQVFLTTEDKDNQVDSRKVFE